MAMTPEDIASKEFALGLRGYDKDEVRAYLQAVADDLRATVEAAAVQPADGDEPGGSTVDAEVVEPAKTGASADRPASGDAVASDAPETDPDASAAALVGAAASPPDWSNLGEEIASVLRSAHEQANALRSDAELQAAAIRQQAEQERTEAADALAAAQHESLDLVAGAQARIDDRLAKAKESATREAEASVAELTAQIGELTTTRDAVRTELAALRARISDAIGSDDDAAADDAVADEELATA